MIRILLFLVNTLMLFLNELCFQCFLEVLSQAMSLKLV